MAPQIPGMPTPPPTDPGQAPHGSQPWYSRGDDFIFLDTAIKAKVAASAVGLHNASRHLSHYLSNTGEDLKLDPDQIMNDEPGLKQRVDGFVTHLLREIAGSATSNGSYSTPVPFQSEWHGYRLTSLNWFLAIGGVNASASGVVTVHDSALESAQPRITLDYQSHLFDRYNWDKGKGIKLGEITVTDREMGGLHTAGLAKEFNMYGSSTIKHYEGVLPIDGSLGLPNGPGNPGR